MTLHMTPPKLSISSENNLSSTSATPSQDASVTALIGKLNNNQNKGTVLYKTLSPRKKFDQYGIDQTDYKAYCLSTTVFPTAVKTPLLGELHETNPHSCGFDIVERPTAETIISSVPSCATSIINAPPPTTVTSQRSTQSAPIVAFVEIPSAEMNATGQRHPSAATGGTKSTANSQVFSDAASGQEENLHTQNNDDVEHHNNIISQNGVTSKGGRGSLKQRTGGDSAPQSSMSSLIGNNIIIHGANNTLSKKRFELQTRTSGKRLQMSPKVQSYSRFDESRLIQYQWKSREIRAAEDKKDGGDIRDTMYLNTFCPEERPVRFNKISLPRISRPSRQRPWTVSESKFSVRSAIAMMGNRENFSRQDRTPPPTIQQSHQTPLRGVLKNGGGIHGGISKSAGHIKLRQQPHYHQPHQHAWKEQAVIDANNNTNNDVIDDGDDKENDNGESLGPKPLLEIRSFLSSSALGDQREKLKGKNGCLNSRVKQCVRFVRYRERLDKHEENRPLKSEHGKYRPFSKTDVRDHNPPNPAPTPELKLQQSVETYQQYVENIARQTNLSSPRPNFSFRSGGTAGSGGVSNPTSGFSRLRSGPKLAGSSVNFDTVDSSLVHSALDSSRPDGIANTADTPRPKNSAIYTKDVSAMGHALDIKRISPVPTVNRVVPGTRGVIQRSNSPRVISASSDGDEVTPGDEEDAYPAPLTPGQHGDTIVVPNASKSECPSEYSVTKDD